MRLLDHCATCYAAFEEECEEDQALSPAHIYREAMYALKKATGDQSGKIKMADGSKTGHGAAGSSASGCGLS